jgi:hypothetical protein
MKHLFLGASVAAVLAFGPAAAWAQTADATPQTQAQTTATDPTGLAVTDTVKVPVLPTIEMLLPTDTPEPIAFTLGAQAIDGIDPRLTDGVTFNGYARKVEVPLSEGTSKIGQVLVTTVSKNDRSEVIDAQGLSSQFQAEDSDSLFPDKTVEVQGNRPALIAALQRLAEAPTEEDQQTKVQNEDGQSGTDGSNGAASNAARNDDLANYQAPEVKATVQTDPVISATMTTEGCDMRVDLAQGVAIQQSRTQTTEDGAITDEGTCTDSDKRYELTRNYSACTDAIDLTALTATPQYQLYYTDGGGGTNFVGECQPDADAATAIVEDTNACPVSVDLTAGAQKAIIQAALVYTNRNGVMIQVRGCEPSANVAPLAMVQDADACSLRHDFDKQQSEELGAWTYEYNGVIYQATRCMPTGRAFPHTTVTSANGAYICEPIVANATVTIQGRQQITVNGVSQYISDCAPIESSQQALLSTTDGCTTISAWTHDFEAGISYGQERFYFLRPNGQREYVTDCQTSGQTYAHSHSLGSWENHDDGLYAQIRTNISITANGAEQVIAANQLLPGAQQIPYGEAGTTTQGTGSYTYEGCTKYEATASVTNWARPDGSIYSQPIGPGANKLIGNACSYDRPQTVESWVPQFSRGLVTLMECPFEGSRTVTREDGVVVTTDKAIKTMPVTANCDDKSGIPGNTISASDLSGCARLCYDEVVSFPNEGTIAGWLVQLGW